MAPSSKAERQLRELARDKAAEADSIAASMCAAYTTEIPAYGRITDPALIEDVRAVSADLVRAWLAVMEMGRPVSPQALMPLLEGARRRAAQGIDLHSLLRAYRVGLRVMWHELMSAPEWRRPSLQAVLGHVAELVLDYGERISTEIAGTYVEELARIAREREHRRSALLDVVLAAPPSEAGDVLKELEQPHAIVVARVSEGLPLERLETIGAVVEDRLNAPLWTVRHRSVIAAAPLVEGHGRSLLLQQLPALTAVPDIMAVSIGGGARNARETRQSYAEAVEALRAGPLLGEQQQPVYDFQDFAPAIAMMAQPEQARRFVATALEPLGDLVHRSWVLPTLEAYITRQGRLKETAAALGVHLNTVKYRLRELRQFANPPLADGERAAALLLALRLQRLLESAGATGDR